MTFISSFKNCVFNNYCNFKGRASRSEFWWFIISYAVLSSIAGAIGMAVGDKNMIITGIVDVLLILPMLGVTWRRLHDIGKSGAWYFINIIPFIGTIWFLVLVCKASQSGANQYGDEPND